MTRLDHHTATPTRLLGLMAMGLALVAANVSPVQAQEAPRVFQACFVPGSGAVYLIGEPGLPEECSVTGRHVHVEFNWTDGLEGKDHGALNGLDQDDHKQYLLVDALTRALIANLNAAGHKITNLAAATAAGEAVRYEQAVKAGDAAGGDLAGAYPAPSVAQIQGHPVSEAEPAADDVLTWDGQQWMPTSPGFAGTAHTHSATDIISGVLPPARGGTGLTSVNSGDILYGGAAGSFGRQAIGGNGQVLTVVDGLPTWADASAGVGDHGALDNLNADDHTQYLLAEGVRSTEEGFAVVRGGSGGAIPVEGPGVRLMWYPGKGAFRAGSAGVDHWDDANIGTFSIGLGTRTIASGDFSVALGSGTSATHNVATAMGWITTASGSQATAMGSHTIASGTSATAMGYSSEARGNTSTALGGSTTAEGTYSTAMGYGATARAYASVALGSWNVPSGSTGSPVATDPVLVVGNGTSDIARSNALVLMRDGNLTIAGTLTQASDIRLKEGISPLGNALERVLQLTPIRYRFRPGTGHPAEAKVGLSAQEVEPLFPELVQRGPDGYLAVAYADLSAVLIAAIKEQQERIDHLERRLERLEAALPASRPPAPQR